MKDITIGYCRVSTQKQSMEGYSIDYQEETLLNYFKKNNINNFKIIKDEGFSGKSLNRKGIQKIIKMIKNGSVSGLFLLKIDRLTRNQMDLQMLRTLFLENNTTFLSINDGNNFSNAIATAYTNFNGTIAEMESSMISERSRSGLLQKARNGEYPYSNVGFGIDRVEGKLNFSTAIEVVKDVYYLYVHEKNPLETVGKLINKKYAKKYNRNFGKHWCRKILNNTIYRGYIEIKTDEAVEKFYFIEPVFTEEEMLKLEQYERPIKYDTSHEYQYLNKVWINDKLAKHTTCQKRGKKYKYYYTDGIYISQVKVDKEIKQYLSKNFKIFNDSLKNKTEKLNELYVNSHINNEEYISMKEKLAKSEIKKFGIKRIEFVDKTPVRVVTT